MITALRVMGAIWSLTCLWMVWAVAVEVRRERRRKRDVRVAQRRPAPRGLWLEEEDVA